MLGLVKEICEPEVSAQRKDLEVKGTALTGSQDLYFLKKQHLGWSTNKKPNDQPSDAFFDRKYLCSYLWSQYGFYIKDGSKDVKEYKKK